MKLRVLRKNVWVSSSAQKGRGATSISREMDILQQWDADKGWVDVPVEKETLNVFEDKISLDLY